MTDFAKKDWKIQLNTTALDTAIFKVAQLGKDLKGLGNITIKANVQGGGGLGKVKDDADAAAKAAQKFEGAIRGLQDQMAKAGIYNEWKKISAEEKLTADNLGNIRNRVREVISETRAMQDNLSNRGIMSHQLKFQQDWSAALKENEQRLRKLADTAKQAAGTTTKAPSLIRGITPADLRLQKDWNAALLENQQRLQSMVAIPPVKVRGITLADLRLQKDWNAALAENERRMKALAGGAGGPKLIRGVSAAELKIQKDWSAALAEDQKRMAAMAPTIDKANASANRFNETMTGVLNTLKRYIIGFVVIKGLIDLFGAAKHALIDYNALQQQVLIGFTTNLNNSRKAAEQFFGAIQTFVDISPFRLEETLKSSQSLLAVLRDIPSEITRIKVAEEALYAVGQQTSALGGGAQEFQQISRALQQIYSKPHLNLEEINRQLIEVGVPAWDLLSKAYKTNTAQIQEWISKGMIPGKEAFKALVNQMQLANWGAMERQAQTFRGALSTIADVLERKVAKAFEQTFSDITDHLVQFSKILQSKEFERWASDTMGKVRFAFAAIGSAMKEIMRYWPAIVAGLVIATASKIVAGLSAITLGFNAWAMGVVALVLAYQKFSIVRDITDRVVGSTLYTLKALSQGFALTVQSIASSLQKIPDFALGPVGIAAKAALGDQSGLAAGVAQQWDVTIAAYKSGKAKFDAAISADSVKIGDGKWFGLDYKKALAEINKAMREKPPVYEPKLGEGADKTAANAKKIYLQLLAAQEKFFEQQKKNWESFGSAVDSLIDKIRNFGERSELAALRAKDFGRTIKDSALTAAEGLAKIVDKMREITGGRDAVIQVFQRMQEKALEMGASPERFAQLQAIVRRVQSMVDPRQTLEGMAKNAEGLNAQIRHEIDLNVKTLNIEIANIGTMRTNAQQAQPAALSSRAGSPMQRQTQWEREHTPGWVSPYTIPTPSPFSKSDKSWAQRLAEGRAAEARRESEWKAFQEKERQQHLRDIQRSAGDYDYTPYKAPGRAPTRGGWKDAAGGGLWGKDTPTAFLPSKSGWHDATGGGLSAAVRQGTKEGWKDATGGGLSTNRFGLVNPHQYTKPQPKAALEAGGNAALPMSIDALKESLEKARLKVLEGANKTPRKWIAPDFSTPWLFGAPMFGMPEKTGFNDESLKGLAATADPKIQAYMKSLTGKQAMGIGGGFQEAGGVLDVIDLEAGLKRLQDQTKNYIGTQKEEQTMLVALREAMLKYGYESEKTSEIEARLREVTRIKTDADYLKAAELDKRSGTNEAGKILAQQMAAYDATQESVKGNKILATALKNTQDMIDAVTKAWQDQTDKLDKWRESVRISTTEQQSQVVTLQQELKLTQLSGDSRERYTQGLEKAAAARRENNAYWAAWKAAVVAGANAMERLKAAQDAFSLQKMIEELKLGIKTTETFNANLAKALEMEAAAAAMMDNWFTDYNDKVSQDVSRRAEIMGEIGDRARFRLMPEGVDKAVAQATLQWQRLNQVADKTKPLFDAAGLAAAQAAFRVDYLAQESTQRWNQFASDISNVFVSAITSTDGFVKSLLKNTADYFTQVASQLASNWIIGQLLGLAGVPFQQPALGGLAGILMGGSGKSKGPTPSPIGYTDYHVGYANGTDYVPMTGNYLLHQGERVVTASENKSYNRGGDTYNITVNAPGGNPREVENAVRRAVARPSGVSAAKQFHAINNVGARNS